MQTFVFPVTDPIRQTIGRKAQHVYRAIGRIPFTQKPVRPVFVVGTGRCGSGVVRNLIASHPDFVSYQSEANDLWHPHSYNYQRRTIETPSMLFDPQEFTKRSLKSWTVERANAIRLIFSGFLTVRGRGRRLVLKSSMVSFMVKQLVQVFPDGLFIHIYRNGPSFVFESVKKNWHKYQHLEDESTMRIHRAQYWSRCLIELHRVSQELKPMGRWLEFAYERLCADPRDVLREISVYAGIDPDAYTFDVSRIQCQNWKGRNIESDKAWEPALNAMREAAALKGYSF